MQLKRLVCVSVKGKLKYDRIYSFCRWRFHKQQHPQCNTSHQLPAPRPRDLRPWIPRALRPLRQARSRRSADAAARSASTPGSRCSPARRCPQPPPRRTRGAPGRPRTDTRHLPQTSECSSCSPPVSQCRSFTDPLFNVVLGFQPHILSFGVCVFMEVRVGSFGLGSVSSATFGRCSPPYFPRHPELKNIVNVHCRKK